MKKNIAILVLGIIVVGSVFGGAVYAQTPAPTKSANMFSELVDFISQKLGLDKNKVQNAVNDFRTQKQQQMQKTAQEREKIWLDGLVKNGKITADQETKILAELAALRKKYQPPTNGNPEDRRTQMDKMRQEWETWAKDNGIDPKIVSPGMGKGMGFGRGRRFIDK